jgi:hypothetical protein
MVAGVATGYTYIPSKRGGLLLSGLPTLLIVLCASALFLASLLTIFDHYDKRPNEATYVAIRKACLKGALYLFIAAPFVELAHRLLPLWGVDLLPDVHGLAENSTFYSPRLGALTHHLDPILGNALAIGLLAAATGGLGLLINKYSTTSRRIATALVGVSMLALSVLMLAGFTKDFLTGEVKAGRRHNRYVIKAEEEPAKFNAILLTNFVLGGTLFTGSAFSLLVVATRPDRQSSQKHKSVNKK